MNRSRQSKVHQGISTKPLHILVVSSLYPPHVVGGAELVAERHARVLQRHGHKVTVFAGRNFSADVPEGSLDLEFSDGIKVYRTPLHSLEPGDNFHIPQIAIRLASVLSAEKPDIVHFHNVIGLGASLIPLASGMGYRTVVTLHDYWGFCYRNTALRDDSSECRAPHECASACLSAIKLIGSPIHIPMRLRRDYVAWCLETADLLVCPSEALFKSYRRAGVGSPDKFVVQSNGIDLDVVRVGKPKPSKKIRFTCIAYLGEHKGIVDLLEAAKTLARDKKMVGKWSLTLIGDGYLRERIQSSLDSVPLAGVARYLGHLSRDRVLKILEETDVVILPSRWPENEPVSLLEAIAAGRAQIATNTGGMIALVDVGKSGELAKPMDPASLAVAMASYVREPAKAARHGAYNLQRRDTFSEEVAVCALEKRYRQVLAKPRTPPDSALILCGGDWPLVQVAETCHSLHKIEHPKRKLRLVWHDWLDNHAKKQARLYWHWSSGPNQTVIRHMLRMGIPLLVPECGLYLSGIANLFGAAFTYDTYLDAAVTLCILPFDADTLAYLRRHTGNAADFLGQWANQASFHLSLGPT